MTIDKTQRIAFLVTTGLTIGLILIGGAGGFSKEFRQLNVEMWIYALAGSLGISTLSLLTYIIMAAIDFSKKRNRIIGWLLCSLASVVTIFIVMYILPPPKSFF